MTVGRTRSAAAVVLCLAVTTSSCSPSGPRPYEPGEISSIELESWTSAEILIDGDTFSDAEMSCIDRVGAGLDPDVLRSGLASSFADSPPEVQRFMTSYFDGCLTDEHMQRWFYTDMVKQRDLGLSEGEAACLSSSVVDLVREHGFAAVFVDRSDSIAADLTARRRACGIGPAKVHLGSDAFHDSGGCNQASFWAVDETGTLALWLSISIGDRRDFQETIELPVPSPSLIELTRGVNLRQGLCGDAVDESYEEHSSTHPVSGTLVLHIGPTPAEGCGTSGELELRDVTFDDGTVIDDYTISTDAIGCFAG
ncbi:MAG: hypothetical protein H6513_14435 [Acidimicrobiaceae bacterium]|nr:hypothetical protein [Acidimicrobiaceae bacterium]MCO5328713.1 hypothetical protein [Ilumatobacteraceae bacterium]